MKRAARIDGNHAEIVKALTDAGMTVQSLAAVGQGVPDILCAWRGLNCLLEVKDPHQDPNKRQLTAAQKEWHQTWAGQLAVVESGEAAVDAVLSHARACGVISEHPAREFFGGGHKGEG